MNERSGLNHYVHTHQDLKHSTTIIKTRHMSGIDNEYRLEDKDLAWVLISFVWISRVKIDRWLQTQGAS